MTHLSLFSSTHKDLKTAGKEAIFFRRQKLCKYTHFSELETSQDKYALCENLIKVPINVVR